MKQIYKENMLANITYLFLDQKKRTSQLATVL